MPSEADLDLLRSHIRDVLDHGSSNVRKAMFEALIAEIQVNSDEVITPIFRLPMIRENDDPETESKNRQPEPAVRALTSMVGNTGIEPVTSPV